MNTVLPSYDGKTKHYKDMNNKNEDRPRNTFTIKKINLIYRIFDFLLIPLMYALGGFKKDIVQQTHGWHTVNIDPSKVELSKSIQIEGLDESKFNNYGGFLHHLGFFHIPIFGGWKNYVILECPESPWYVGWLSKGFSQIQCLLIVGDKVKVLTGREGNKTIFFGVDRNGKQVSIKKLDQGILGDGKYVSVPLY